MSLMDRIRFVMDRTFFHDVYRDYQSPNSQYSELINDYMIVRLCFDNCKFFFVPKPVRDAVGAELVKHNAAMGPIIHQSFMPYVHVVQTPEMEAELTNDEWVWFTSSAASSLYPEVYMLTSVGFKKLKSKVEIFFPSKSELRFKDALGWDVINSIDAWDLITKNEDSNIFRLVLTELKKLDKWKDFKFLKRA